jgi:hypothetical protein
VQSYPKISGLAHKSRGSNPSLSGMSNPSDRLRFIVVPI